MKHLAILFLFLVAVLTIGNSAVGRSGGTETTDSGAAEVHAQHGAKSDQPQPADQAEPIDQSQPTGASPAALAQAECPIMGGEIDKEVYVDHDGKRVYFCCPPCIKKFMRDPDLNIEKLEATGVVLEPAPESS